jgi:hypothetical protein
MRKKTAGFPGGSVLRWNAFQGEPVWVLIMASPQPSTDFTLASQPSDSFLVFHGLQSPQGQTPGRIPC